MAVNNWMVALLLIVCLMPAVAVVHTAETMDVPAAEPVPVTELEPDATLQRRAAYVRTLEDELLAAYPGAHGMDYEVVQLLYSLKYFAGTEEGGGPGIMPGPDDLTEDEAIAIGVAGVQAKHGLTDEELESMVIKAYYWNHEEDNMPPYWYVVVGLREDGYERFSAVVYSPSGEIYVHDENFGNG